MKERCPWVTEGNDLCKAYHDTEWGVPVHDDQKHFEFLLLEGAQAGLSWITILKRRQGYAKAFANFDAEKVASFDDKKVAKLMEFDGIIKNRLKIASAVNNARHFLEIQEEFDSFDNYVWRFCDGKPIQNRWRALKEVPAETKESKALSKDLKARGCTFVGPVVIYAHMQATGLVNDHLVNCFRYKEVAR